ncbi:MAG: glycosyltransferase family 2 protein [bacterium]|nr:glycosyltransferase family 2 protein [bacterium]
MSKLPISVHILTWNSAATLKCALESVKDCEEIIVLDGGSTDTTCDIAKEYGATIIQQENTGPIHDFAAVRNQVLARANQPWILSLDSDEYLSEELQLELKQITQNPQPLAYFIPRVYVLPDGRRVDYATTYPNKRLYFFHQDAIEQWIKPVHERPALQPGTKAIDCKGPSLAPLGSVEEYRAKNLRYLKIEKEKSKGKGWIDWLINRVFHTLRSRLIGLLRLLWIWCIPRKGVRMPLKLEIARFWYGWKLIVGTCPIRLHSK